jgi:hypothetical protein
VVILRSHSREIAKLRLREVKMKEEIEASKLQAEREATEARLKALGLQAQIARTVGKSPLRRRERETADNTRANASRVVSSAATRSPTTVKISVVSQTKQVQSQSTTPLSHRASVAEEVRLRCIWACCKCTLSSLSALQARLRAARRVHEAKVRAEQTEAAQRAIERGREDKKWAARDKRVCYLRCGG